MTPADRAEPFWLTVFLDYPAAEFEAGVGFWQAATGFPLSASRGDAGEFASLLPAAGDGYLKVQRLGDGPTRLHLDVHVADPWAAAEAAEAAGAGLVAESRHGSFVLRSPAGFTFCLVTHAAATVPEPASWPSGHRSRVSRLCLDVPRKSYAAEATFFERLLGGSWLRLADPETMLRPAGDGPLDVRLQPAELASEVTSHLHVVTDDLDAEVARLAGFGARPRAARTGKTIMEVPGGSALCVVALEAAGLT
ncbi:MAG: VOC family protein [Propionibacteriaceae bacterium]|nr:VOC family protein [Propionibacteriaceae bacterium]